MCVCGCECVCVPACVPVGVPACLLCASSHTHLGARLPARAQRLQPVTVALTDCTELPDVGIALQQLLATEYGLPMSLHLHHHSPYYSIAVLDLARFRFLH